MCHDGRTPHACTKDEATWPDQTHWFQQVVEVAAQDRKTLLREPLALVAPLGDTDGRCGRLEELQSA